MPTMRLLLPLVFSSVLPLVLCGPSPSSASLFKRTRKTPIPSGFTKLNPPPSNTMMEVRIGLKAADRAGLERRLYAASTPGSAEYRQWLEKEEIKSYAAPSVDTRSAVSSWLHSQGIAETAITIAGAWDEYLSFSLPVSKANLLLNADYNNYTYHDSETSSSLKQGESWALHTLSYSLPAELKEHITTLHPGISFIPPLKPKISGFHSRSKMTEKTRRANPAPESCATEVAPHCLQDLYGIPSTPAPATQPPSVIGVTGLHSQWAQEADLQQFLTKYRPDLPSNTSFRLVSVANGTNPQGPGLGGSEANLDVQYTVGVATGTPVDFISVGDIFESFFDGLLDLAEYLSATDEPPQVVTTSYGLTEVFLSEDTADLLHEVCDAFMAVTARGISLLVSSGDDGAAGCIDETNPQRLFTEFPGSCPYVTSVGSVGGIMPEVASYFSGGGFSNFFTRPSYQDTVVSSYLSSLSSSSFPSNEGLYNLTGRATPDISAQGENVPIITNGREAMQLGTSCSSPIFASLIAGVNARLIADGKGVLGFLNPFIYSNPQAFFDIVNGSNPGFPPNDPDCVTTGWPALEGWDPATGFGTPDFNALSTAAGL
ncbi:peptidase S8/S53 domain-containing protein [Mycena rebaudengoi]|nr:peptidase S8/S53 domain-containing protein [Mycena rebaudengoi]